MISNSNRNFFAPLAKPVSNIHQKVLSSVQQLGIPKILYGDDLLCQAKSGMGKTAVFVLGVLHSIKIPGDPFQCLVLCPTRELAIQITKEFDRLGKFITGLRTIQLMGGVSLDTQKLKIETNPPHIIIGTPGRTLDLIDREIIKLDHLKYFILDECDKMLDNIGKPRSVLLPSGQSLTQKCAKMFRRSISRPSQPNRL